MLYSFDSGVAAFYPAYSRALCTCIFRGAIQRSTVRNGQIVLSSLIFKIILFMDVVICCLRRQKKIFCCLLYFYSFLEDKLSFLRLTFGLPNGDGTHPPKVFRCHTFCIWNKKIRFRLLLGVHLRTFRGINCYDSPCHSRVIA